MSTPARVWPAVPEPFWRRQAEVAPETPSESPADDPGPVRAASLPENSPADAAGMVALSSSSPCFTEPR